MSIRKKYVLYFGVYVWSTFVPKTYHSGFQGTLATFFYRLDSCVNVECQQTSTCCILVWMCGKLYLSTLHVQPSSYVKKPLKNISFFFPFNLFKSFKKDMLRQLNSNRRDFNLCIIRRKKDTIFEKFKGKTNTPLLNLIQL